MIYIFDLIFIISYLLYFDIVKRMIKSQKRIDDFFKNSNSSNDKYNIKRYFYLIIEDKFKPKCHAYWTDRKPDKINFIEQVTCDYIKKGYYFYICGYFEDYEEKAYRFNIEKVYNNIEYLKSHLQKNIRKGNEILAVQTCYHLFKLDLNELLRILPIIMLEDVMLHESFSTLIWFMVANSNSNFKMKIYMYEWILGLIYILCKIDVKDDIKDELSNVDIDNNNVANDLPVVDKLNNYGKSDYSQEEYSLLYSIHIRIAYGSNKSDLKMLNDYIDIWEKRFREKSTNIKINKIDINPICVYVKELTLNDWDLSAIDYHCHPKLLEFIIKKYDNFDIDKLKELIMYHSSSINYRSKPIIYDSENWNIIKEYLKKTQKYLLDSNH